MEKIEKVEKGSMLTSEKVNQIITALNKLRAAVDEKIVYAIRDMSNKLGDVEKETKEMGGKIERVYETMRVIGKMRIEDCVYSRDGYCEHITMAIPDPAKVDISTTQKNGRYYPRVRWVDCYFCTKYEVPPSYVEKKKKK